MDVTGMKICEGKCKKPFKPIFEGQKVCTQCAIAPRRKTFDPISEKIQENSTPIKEANMPIEKICVEPDCQKSFDGPGRRCGECQKKRKAKYNAVYNKKREMKRPKKVIKELVKNRPQPMNKLLGSGTIEPDYSNLIPPAIQDNQMMKAAIETILKGGATVRMADMEITFKKI